MKEGEESLAKLGDGNDDEFAWRSHGFEVEAESFGENGEKDERKVRENEMKREKGMW